MNKLIELAIVLLGVTVLSFGLLHLLPGDVVVTVLGDNATPEAEAALRAQLGLDDPLPVRYFDWLTAAIQGDLGQSVVTRYPVSELLLNRIPVTVELTLVTLLLAVALSVPAALIAARFRNHWPDKALSLASYAAIASPPFIVGIVLIYFVSVRWQLLPATGWNTLSDGFGAHLSTLLLPVLSLLLVEFALFMRILRSDLVSQLTDEDYPIAARAKGATMQAVMLKHVFRNSTLPFLTIVGLQFGVLMGGAVVIETLFGLPGIGQLLVTSIYSRDVTTVQGVVVFIAVIFVLVNALVDMLYRQIDPRIKHEAKR